jgi:hypothetical protein
MKPSVYFPILIFLALFSLTGCVSSSGTPSAASKDSFKQLQSFMTNRRVTAVLNLHVHGNHFVNSDGDAIAGKNQSARFGSKGLFTKKYALAEGESGYILSMGMMGSSKMVVVVSKSKGIAGAWNPSNIYIEYGRPIVPEDHTPQAFAIALSSVLDIEGVKPTGELEKLLESLD